MLLPLCLALLVACGTSVRSLPQEGFNAIEGVRLYNAIDEVGRHPVTLDVNLTEFAGRDACIKVAWSGVKHPQFDDWLGIFAPAYANVKDSTPIKYKLATVSETHFEEGRGSTTCVSAPAKLERLRIFPWQTTQGATTKHSMPCRDLSIGLVVKSCVCVRLRSSDLVLCLLVKVHVPLPLCQQFQDPMKR